MAPLLMTPRLALDPTEAGDAPALHRHWADPDVRRFLWDDRVVTPAEVEAVVAGSAASFERDGFGLWAIRLRAGGFVGAAGYWPFHEPPRIELVVSLDPAHWGRGLAREAAGALIGYAFDTLAWDVVHASTDAPNQPSIRLMERLGMAREADGPGRTSAVCYALRRPGPPS